MDKIGQGVSLSRTVVYSPQKQVLDHESSVVFRDIRIESGHQLLQRIGLVDGHQPGTQDIVGSVQGNRQVDLPVFGTKTFNTRNNTARGNRDASLSQIEAIFVVQQQNGLLDIVVVEKRLPHAHKDDVGDLFSFGFQLAGKGQHLFSDLRRREDSLETQVPSSAERTINLAASLGGDAHRTTAVSVLDKNALYGEVVMSEEQVLP